MRKIVFGAVGAIALALCSCGSKSGAGVEAADGFTVDSVGIVDSLTVGECLATVTIAGQYPVEGPVALVDSVRLWVAEQISRVSSYDGSVLFDVTPELIADGKKLVETCSDSLLAGADRDFAGYADENWSINYEYDVHFGTTYESEHLLTYYVTAYGYQGGAHGGSTAVNATFNRADGSILTYDAVFLPEKRGELIEMIMEGLWEQYFEEGNGEGTLADQLLIDPLDLDLPAALPDFDQNGIVFTYQQYEIAPYAAGMPSCVLSYDQLRPLMRPAVCNLLTSEKK